MTSLGRELATIVQTAAIVPWVELPPLPRGTKGMGDNDMDRDRFELIVCQGRVADRTAGALPGALATGRALADYLGVPARTVGDPSDPIEDDWSSSLTAAAGTLIALTNAVAAALEAGQAPLLATNTCAATLGTLPVAAQHDAGLVVLWIDAHADYHTPDTTESGYLGGMALAGVCGRWDSGHGAGVNPAQVILIGARDIDQAEADAIAATGVSVLQPYEATPETVASLVGDARVWIHVD